MHDPADSLRVGPLAVEPFNLDPLEDDDMYADGFSCTPGAHNSFRNGSRPDLPGSAPPPAVRRSSSDSVASYPLFKAREPKLVDPSLVVPSLAAPSLSAPPLPSVLPPSISALPPPPPVQLNIYEEDNIYADGSSLPISTPPSVLGHAPPLSAPAPPGVLPPGPPPPPPGGVPHHSPVHPPRSFPGRPAPKPS